MKTIFSNKSYFTILLTFAFAILNFYFVPFFYNDPYYDDKLFPKIFVPTLILFSFLYLFFGEVRTKIIIVDFKNKEIIVKRFLGIKIDNFKFSKIEGWKYSMLISNGGFYEYLYLIDFNNKKIIKISEFYHTNYSDVKKYVEDNFKKLGYESFSYIDELKEIFT